MKKLLMFTMVALCSIGMWAQSPENVEIFVAPGKLWSNWQEGYTLVVSVKRWNGSDTDENNWASFEFAPIGTTYEGATVYKGEIEVVYAGFAQMKFEAKNHEADFTYTFWPPETQDGHWIDKAAWESKIFISWNQQDGIRDFLHYTDYRYNLYVRNDNKWNSVWLRVGNDNSSAAYPFTHIQGTNWWKCAAPDKCCLSHLVITDNGEHAGDGIAVRDYAAGTNRLYESTYSISVDHWYAIGDGPIADGNHYYWGMDDQLYFLDQLIYSEAGHRVYFDNSNSHWAQAYLRIGRSEATGLGAYASTWPMTRIGESDIWFVDTEDWTNAQAWTITDTDANNGDGHSVYDLPAGANRLYFYENNIGEDIHYTAIGAEPQGESDGVSFWENYRSELYTRNVAAGSYGTICLPKAAASYIGATMFRVVDKTENNDIVIEEVSAMAAGVPYIFMATGDQVCVSLTGDAGPAQSANGLIGHIGDAPLLLTPDANKYILARNKVWQVDVNVNIPSNFAYFDVSAINALSQAPGKRRYVLAGNQTATGIGQITNYQSPITNKVIRDGHLYILCGEDMYNAQGQMIR